MLELLEGLERDQAGGGQRGIRLLLLVPLLVEGTQLPQASEDQLIRGEAQEGRRALGPEGDEDGELIEPAAELPGHQVGRLDLAPGARDDHVEVLAGLAPQGIPNRQDVRVDERAAHEDKTGALAISEQLGRQLTYLLLGGGHILLPGGHRCPPLCVLCRALASPSRS